MLNILSIRVLMIIAAMIAATGWAGAATPDAAAPAPASTAARPNMVVILADDLGYGDVQCLNPKRGRIRTPQLDRLAGQGIVFTDAHSGSSVCTPTRYGLLTGRYAWRTRLQNGVLDGFSPPLIDQRRLTVAGLLQANGYHTAGIGKWHLGMNLPVRRSGGSTKPTTDPEGTNTDLALPIADGPITRGFDTFFGISASLDMPPFAFIDNDHFTEKPTARKKWVRTGIAAPGFEAVDVLPTLTQKAVDYLRQRAGEKTPFFLYLALNSPHTPILPAAPWQGRSGLSAYGDFVMQTDDAVGQVLAALDRFQLASNTLVLFTSDNGCSPAAGVADLERAGHFPSAQYRGYKADIWEGGHRVPLLVRWPARVKAGTRCDGMICLTDFMATAAELLGVTLPENAAEDSFSFLPALLGTGQSARTSMVHHSIQGKFAIRTGNWKLEFCPGSGGWAAPRDPAAARQGLPALQLYDLAGDESERANVQATHSDVVARLTRELELIVQQGRSTPGSPQTNDVPIDFRKPVTKGENAENCLDFSELGLRLQLLIIGTNRDSATVSLAITNISNQDGFFRLPSPFGVTNRLRSSFAPYPPYVALLVKHPKSGNEEQFVLSSFQVLHGPGERVFVKRGASRELEYPLKSFCLSGPEGPREAQGFNACLGNGDSEVEVRAVIFQKGGESRLVSSPQMLRCSYPDFLFKGQFKSGGP